MTPRVVSREEWGSTRPRGVIADIPLPIRTVIVHHSVTAGDESAQMRQVERTHAHMRDVAYTVGVGQSGNLYEARDGVFDTTVDVGGHTAGWNSKGYAVVALGNFETYEPSNQLIASINWLIAVKQYQGVLVGPEALTIIPHRDAASDGTIRPGGGKTACCGQRLIARLGELGKWQPPTDTAPITYGPEIKEEDVRMAFAFITADPDGNGFTSIPGRAAGVPGFQGPHPPSDGYWPHLRYRPTLSHQERDGAVIVTLTDAPPHAAVGIYQPIA